MLEILYCPSNKTNALDQLMRLIPELRINSIEDTNINDSNYDHTGITMDAD
jgi:type IV secretory pathway ATPase VirB11/archaellum biosynthesis ATPase